MSDGLYLLQLTTAQRLELIDAMIDQMVERDMWGKDTAPLREVLALILGARWFSGNSIGKFRQIINLVEKLPTNTVS